MAVGPLVDPLVYEQLTRAAAVSRRRGATDVTFADLFTVLFHRPLSAALTHHLAAAVTLADERGDPVVSEAHLFLAALNGNRNSLISDMLGRWDEAGRASLIEISERFLTQMKEESDARNLPG